MGIAWLSFAIARLVTYSRYYEMADTRSVEIFGTVALVDTRFACDLLLHTYNGFYPLTRSVAPKGSCYGAERVVTKSCCDGKLRLCIDERLWEFLTPWLSTP